MQLKIFTFSVRCVDRVIPTKFGGHNKLAACPLIALDHVSQHYFTFATIESVTGIEKIDSALKGRLNDRFTGRVGQLRRIILPNRQAKHRYFESGFAEISVKQKKFI